MREKSNDNYIIAYDNGNEVRLHEGFKHNEKEGITDSTCPFCNHTVTVKTWRKKRCQCGVYHISFNRAVDDKNIYGGRRGNGSEEIKIVFNSRLLRRLREDRGLTMREVYKACDISVSYLSQLETGFEKVNPAFDVLYRISRYFNLKMDDFIKKE